MRHRSHPLRNLEKTNAVCEGPFPQPIHLRPDSNSRLVENRSDTVGKEQLASLAFRSDSMLAVDGCSLVFLEGRVFN